MKMKRGIDKAVGVVVDELRRCGKYQESPTSAKVYEMNAEQLAMQVQVYFWRLY